MLPSSRPATATSQPHLKPAPGPASSHSSSASPPPFHVNATASTSSLRTSPDTELPALDLNGPRPSRVKRVAEVEPQDLDDGGDSEGDYKPRTGSPPSTKRSKNGSSAVKAKRVGRGKDSKGESAVWGPEVDGALHRAAFDLLPKMERAAKIHVDGEPLARNQLIGWYVFRMTGEERRRKQVMSRLQVLNCTTSLAPPDDWPPGSLQEFFGPNYTINVNSGRVHVTSIRADIPKVKSTPHGEYTRHVSPSQSSQFAPAQPLQFLPSQPRQVQPSLPRPIPPPQRPRVQPSFPPPIPHPQLPPLSPSPPPPPPRIRPPAPHFLSRPNPSAKAKPLAFKVTSSGFAAPRAVSPQVSQSDSPRLPSPFRIASPRQIASSSQRTRSTSVPAWVNAVATSEGTSSGSLPFPPLRRTSSAPIPAISLPTPTQNSPPAVQPAVLSCPIAPVALELWLQGDQDGPTHLLTRLDANGGAGPGNVVYLDGTDHRFPGLAAMDREFTCQLLHLKLNLSLPSLPFATSAIQARFDLTAIDSQPLVSITTIYSSKGHLVGQLPEQLHPAIPLDPRTSPLRHQFVYHAPFATEFWTELLRMPLDPRGVLSFAKRGNERGELDRRLGGMSMIQEFVVLQPNGRAKGRGISPGSERGKVVLVILYEFGYTEWAASGEVEMSFVSLEREAVEEVEEGVSSGFAPPRSRLPRSSQVDKGPSGCGNGPLQ